MRAVVLFGALLLGGCAANTFKDTVTKFDTAVGAVDTAVKQYSSRDTDYAFAATTQGLLKSRSLINFKTAGCRLGAKTGDCQLEYQDAGQWKALAKPKELDVAKLSSAIKKYSEGLSGIVNANTADDFDAAIDSLSSGLKTLGTDAGLDQKSNAIVDIAPIGTIVKFVGTTAIEYERLRILRTSVTRADPIIQAASRALAKVAGDQQRRAIALQANLIFVEAQRYSVIASTRPASDIAAINDKTMLLSSAIDGQSRVQQLIKSDVRTAILGIGTAHAELAKSVNSPDLSIKELYAAMQKFYKDAKAAYDAAGNIK